MDRMSIGTDVSIATNRQGERCRRAPSLVVVTTFTARPATRQAARERLLAMVDPALDALRALQTGRREHCGRSDTDRDPVVLRAAQLVLDRAGYHPSVTVVQAAPPDEYENLNEDELIERLETLLEKTKAARDARRQQMLPAAQDAELLDAFVVPDDDDTPIHEPAVQIPTGKIASPEGTDGND